MDPRYQQLADLTDKEAKITKGKYAFVGFGRSSVLVKDVDTVGEEGQKLQNALAQVIALEEAAKQGADVGEALGFANQALSKLKEKANQRISKLSSDLAGFGQQAETKRKYNISTNRIGKGRRSFTLKARQPAQPQRTQTLQKSTRLSRPITAIISKERGAKLSNSRI